jgi:hypothetical protein
MTLSTTRKKEAIPHKRGIAFYLYKDMRELNYFAVNIGPACLMSSET